MDFPRRPAGKGLAHQSLPIAAVRPQQMHHQPGGARLGASSRRFVGHFHPDFREAPLLVQAQLAAAHVGGVVHLQHHVRQAILVHLDGVAPALHLSRTQVEHLVGLQDALALARLVAQQQVHRAAGVDGRAPILGNAFGQPSEALRGDFVVVASRLAYHRDLGLGVPEFKAAVVVGNSAAGNPLRHAARKILLGEANRRALRGSGEKRMGGVCRGRRLGLHESNLDSHNVLTMVANETNHSIG